MFKTGRLAIERARHLRWLQHAALWAEREPEKGGSPHPSVKVGAVLVDTLDEEIAIGANRFATGVDYKDAERYADGTRSMWINCAEQMAIAAALRKHAHVEGARMYITLEPCTVCAGLIAECGIKEIIVPKDSCNAYGRLKAKWKKSITIGRLKLKEAGVKTIYIDMDEA